MTFFRFVHDDCGFNAQILNVYYENGTVLIEGVCVRCGVGLTRTYDIERPQTKPKKKEVWTAEDKEFLKELKVSL